MVVTELVDLRSQVGVGVALGDLEPHAGGVSVAEDPIAERSIELHPGPVAVGDVAPLGEAPEEVPRVLVRARVHRLIGGFPRRVELVGRRAVARVSGHVLLVC